MEFLICMLLASLLTGGRVGVDLLHGWKGTTPPHVEKARIKAERAKLKAEQAAAALAGTRPAIAAGKPRLRDVAAVYWGDALTDVIDAHNRKREARANPVATTGAGSPKGPSLGQQVKDLLLRPVGEPATPAAPDVPAAPVVDKVPTWVCDGCALNFTGPPPANSRCVPCSRPEDQGARSGPAKGRSTRKKLYDLGPDNCLECGEAGEVIQRPDGRTFVHDRTGERCPGIEPDPPTPEAESRRPLFARPAGVSLPVWETATRTHPPCPNCGTPTTLQGPHDSLHAYFHCPACNDITESWGWEGIAAQFRTGGAPEPSATARPATPKRHSAGRQTDNPSRAEQDTRCPACHGEHSPFACPADAARWAETTPAPTSPQDPAIEGEPMTQSTSTGSATGDAHNVETAIAECSALDDDLTAINTALDLIDERIDSAGKAAELIEAFLTSKNVDDTAVGGMSVARDMLSPTHIKALMDAVSAAKQGVKNAMDELVRLQDLEQQLNGADGSVLNGR